MVVVFFLVILVLELIIELSASAGIDHAPRSLIKLNKCTFLWLMGPDDPQPKGLAYSFSHLVLATFVHSLVVKYLFVFNSPPCPPQQGARCRMSLSTYTLSADLSQIL